MKEVYILLLLASVVRLNSIDSLHPKDFVSLYLNKNFSIPSEYKGISLSFYDDRDFPADLVQRYRLMTKVDWTKLYDFLVPNPFQGTTDSNYLMAVFNFLR